MFNHLHRFAKPIAAATLLLACTGIQAQNTQAEAPAQTTPTVRARVTHTSRQANIGFDESGNISSRNDSFTVQLQLEMPNDGAILSQTGVDTTRVVTDQGQVLQNQNRNSGMSNSYRIADAMVNRLTNSGSRSSSMGVSLNLTPYRAGASSLTELSGVVEYERGKGNPSKAKLGLLSELEGRPVRLAGISEDHIVIRPRRGTLRTIRIPMSAMANIVGIEFATPAGVPIVARFSSQGGDNNYRDIGVYNLPDGDAVLSLTVYKETETVRAPFTVTNVPLPDATDTAANKAEVVVELD